MVCFVKTFANLGKVLFMADVSCKYDGILIEVDYYMNKEEKLIHAREVSPPS